MKNKLASGRVVALLLVCGVVFSIGQSLAGPSGTAAPGNDAFAAIPVVPSTEMATMRGRAGDVTIVSSNQEFKSTVKDTQFQADTINTGAVTVGEKAFAGFSGLGLNVLNSGNSNSINAGVNVTINLH